jgi:hypothetical protein
MELVVKMLTPDAKVVVVIPDSIDVHTKDVPLSVPSSASAASPSKVIFCPHDTTFVPEGEVIVTTGTRLELPPPPPPLPEPTVRRTPVKRIIISNATAEP